MCVLFRFVLYASFMYCKVRVEIHESRVEIHARCEGSVDFHRTFVGFHQTCVDFHPACVDFHFSSVDFYIMCVW